MLLLKTNGNNGGPSDVAGEILVDDDDDDDDDMMSPASTSTPSRGLRNFFRKRHKSVTIGFVDVLQCSLSESHKIVITHGAVWVGHSGPFVCLSET